MLLQSFGRLRRNRRSEVVGRRPHGRTSEAQPADLSLSGNRYLTGSCALDVTWLGRSSFADAGAARGAASNAAVVDA
jgi:hypothetical protein